MPAILCPQKTAFIKKPSLLSKCTRNCHSGLEKIQQRIHKEIRCFKRAINRPKTDPPLFFFSNLLINGQAFIISGKTIFNFSLLCKGGQGKRRNIIINPRFYFTDTQNNYETDVTYMNPRCQLLVR